MYNIILILSFCVVSVAAYGESQQQKGEKKMATLIIDEQFTGNTVAHYQSRGWFDGVGGIGTGYFFEHNSVLGKNVWYARWNAGQTGEPGGASGWRFNTTGAENANGVSFYGLVKYQGLLQYPGNCHTPHRFLQGVTGSGSVYAGSSIIIEAGRQNHTEADYNGVWRSTSRAFNLNWVAPERADTDWSRTNYLEDGPWYEVAAWALAPANARGSTPNGLHLVYRPYGTTQWITLVNWRNRSDFVTRVGGAMSQFMLGPYLHGSSPVEARMYLGRVMLWYGNAIADNQLPSAGSGGGGGGGETPIDTTGPVITDKVVVTTATTATIGWTTDEDSNTVVDYGPTETRGTIVRGDPSTRNHVVELTGLTPSTTYYYRFSSRDASGNTTMDQANSTFVTKAVADTTRPVISSINVTTETTTANVTWTTDENSNSNVDYGTTTAYGKSAVGNADTQNHVVAIAGLTEGTTYNYRVRSADAAGNEAVSDNAIFVTEKTPVTPVEVSLDDLTDVALAAPVEGQVMMYRDGQWVNVDARPLVAQLVEEILGATSLVVNKPSA